MRILIEGVGSTSWGPLLPKLKEVSTYIAGADINELSWGFHEIDRPCLVNKYEDPDIWKDLEKICIDLNIEVVLPSINEGLAGWAELKNKLHKKSIEVIISPLPTIETFIDKWKTFLFFKEKNIPTPNTSLQRDYNLLKPRIGRGGYGIRILKKNESVNMENHITQEYLEGDEYSIDAFCDYKGEPTCIVIRKRIETQSGISIKGITIKDEEIESYANKIFNSIQFFGPINIQCIRSDKGIYFIEVNPRISGGLSLSMAATDNWFKWIKHIIRGGTLSKTPTQIDTVMMRYFSDVIFDAKTAKIY